MRHLWLRKFEVLCLNQLVVLAREFESRSGEILNLIAKIKRDQQPLRAPGVGKHNWSTQVDEGRNS